MVRPTRHNNWILVLLGALCVVTPFAIDMYLPAFSAIAAEFRTTTPEISLTLSTYFVGFSLGHGRQRTKDGGVGRYGGTGEGPSWVPGTG